MKVDNGGRSISYPLAKILPTLLSAFCLILTVASSAKFCTIELIIKSCSSATITDFLCAYFSLQRLELASNAAMLPATALGLETVTN